MDYCYSGNEMVGEIITIVIKGSRQYRVSFEHHPMRQKIDTPYHTFIYGIIKLFVRDKCCCKTRFNVNVR